MHVHIIAVGERMPGWVDAGFREYAKRLPAHWRLQLTEIAAGRRTKGADIGRIVETEGARIVAATPAGAWTVALERTGRGVSTVELAQALEARMSQGSDIAFWIGGPEGLAPACREQARACWSLSALTLAHPVVRVVLAEQLYRAYSILQKLPYHR